MNHVNRTSVNTQCEHTLVHEPCGQNQWNTQYEQTPVHEPCEQNQCEHSVWTDPSPWTMWTEPVWTLNGEQTLVHEPCEQNQYGHCEQTLVHEPCGQNQCEHSMWTDPSPWTMWTEHVLTLNVTRP